MGEVKFGLFLIQLSLVSALNVYIAPPAVLQPAKTKVMLSCETSSTNDNIEITWEIDDKEVPLMPASGLMKEEVYVLANNSLYIKSLRRRNTGEYTCIATEDNVKRYAKVKVEIAYLQKVDVINPLMVFHNTDAKIACVKPLGKPMPSVSWKFNGLPLTPPGRYNIDWTLTIKQPLSEKDEGNYTCVASNTFKVRERDTSLKVTIFGNLEVTPQTRQILEKENSKFTCTSKAVPPLPVLWNRLKKSCNIKSGIQSCQTAIEKIPVNGTVTSKDGELIISNAVYTDAGEYLCSATLGSEMQSESVRLNVTELVKVNAALQYNKPTRNLRTQKNTSLRCFFRGDGNITYSWSKLNATKLPDNMKVKNSTLEITNLNFKDAGVYVCTAKGDHNSASSRVRLVVFRSAEFVVKPENVSVVLGKSAWVHCQGEGDPEPKVSYLRNNKDELRNNSNYEVWPNGTMQIKKMTKDDVGTFHCWLTQSYHIGATSFSVKIKEAQKVEESGSMMKTVAIAVGCAGVYILLVIGLMIYCRARRARLIKKGIITEVEDGEFAKEPLMNNESIPLEERERALEKWNFPREDVEEIQTLGHGKMGRVFKARAAGITRDEKSTLVAVKQFDGTGEDYKAEFDLEVEMFSQLNHDNVARLMGVNVDVTPYYIITEFSDEGDLKEYLQSKPDLTPTERLNISFGVASGMEYLIKQRYVHRDLAARNCVVFPNNGVKVSFLSLCEDVYSDDYYLLNDIPVPLRWLSPEAIKSGHYSEKSDVWSFGVTMWEIFSGGKKPYADLDNKEVQESVCSDVRLPTLVECPKHVTAVMERCWLVDISQRPTFEELTCAIAEINLDKE